MPSYSRSRSPSRSNLNLLNFFNASELAKKPTKQAKVPTYLMPKTRRNSIYKSTNPFSRRNKNTNAEYRSIIEYRNKEMLEAMWIKKVQKMEGIHANPNNPIYATLKRMFIEEEIDELVQAERQTLEYSFGQPREWSSQHKPTLQLPTQALQLPHQALQVPPQALQLPTQACNNLGGVGCGVMGGGKNPKSTRRRKRR